MTPYAEKIMNQTLPLIFAATLALIAPMNSTAQSTNGTLTPVPISKPEAN